MFHMGIAKFNHNPATLKPCNPETSRIIVMNPAVGGPTNHELA